MWPPRVHYTVGIALTATCIATTLYALHKSGLQEFTLLQEQSSTTSSSFTAILKNCALWKQFGVVCAVSFFWFAVATFIRYMNMNPPQITRRHPIELDPRLFKSGSEIAHDLREGKYSSVEITTLFINHIKNIDKFHVNAIVFERFELALEEAAKADLKLQKKLITGGKNDRNAAAVVDGEGEWLLGVPCVIKECFAMEGCSNCVGHPMRRHHRSSEDAPTVARLRKAGVVVVGTTNTSELCMWLESSNHVYGTTCNPYDATRIVGGSSGGEGAAVSSLFAPFGLGSDIGGSIRIPSFFNGIFGHKPSTRLVPNKAQYPGTKTLGNFVLCTGPMSRHPQDLYPLLKTLATGGFLEDPKQYPPCPMPRDPREITIDKTKTIYLIESLELPLTFLSDDQRKATRLVATTLAARTGCKLVEVNLRDASKCPPGWERMRRAIELWSAVMDRDAVKYVSLLEGGYPIDKPYRVFFELVKWFAGASLHTFPSIVLGVIETLQHMLISSKTQDAFVDMALDLTSSIGDVLGDNGVIICPTLPFAAPTHASPKLLSLSFTYTALFNALQLPATAVPIWMDEQQKLPLGVQVVSKWGNDQLSLAMALALNEKTPYCYHRVPQWIRKGKN